MSQHWPKVEIIFRGDSGFCRWKLLRWCDRHHVRYIVGIAKNKRLKRKSKTWTDLAEHLYRTTGKKQRVFATHCYGARTWDRQRRVILNGLLPELLLTTSECCPGTLINNGGCGRCA